MRIWGIDMQEIVGETLVEDLPLLTLTKIIPGVRDPAALDQGTQPTTKTYLISGMITDYTDDERKDDPDITKHDKKLSLVGKSLAEAGVLPSVDDTITDTDGTVYRIISVNTNVVQTTYHCQCRG